MYFILYFNFNHLNFNYTPIEHLHNRFERQLLSMST